MKEVMYGSREERRGVKRVHRGQESAPSDRESTIPSSAGALQRSRSSFTGAQEAALNKEARRMRNKNKFVTKNSVLTFMNKPCNKSLFELRSPRCVENKLREALRQLRAYNSR